ncbi:unnamed protein product [Coffea canephora]|uniref:Uncharacterized protein n=1 Tax=Coffea canephora TaxID=49390 RepID=A0A068V5L8_COFCA|nr:unnamed protein product [Coffea canephora]
MKVHALTTKTGIPLKITATAKLPTRNEEHQYQREAIQATFSLKVLRVELMLACYNLWHREKKQD